jgi:hypothetical protein
MAWFREFTLRNGTKKRIRIEEGKTLKQEMNQLDIRETDIFQMQMIEVQENGKDRGSNRNHLSSSHSYRRK